MHKYQYFVNISDTIYGIIFKVKTHELKSLHTPFISFVGQTVAQNSVQCYSVPCVTYGLNQHYCTMSHLRKLLNSAEVQHVFSHFLPQAPGEYDKAFLQQGHTDCWLVVFLESRRGDKADFLNDGAMLPCRFFFHPVMLSGMLASISYFKREENAPEQQNHNTKQHEKPRDAINKVKALAKRD